MQKPKYKAGDSIWLVKPSNIENQIIKFVSINSDGKTIYWVSNHSKRENDIFPDFQSAMVEFVARRKWEATPCIKETRNDKEKI